MKALGLEEIIDQAIDNMLDQILEAWEAGEEQGGGIAIVEEEDGGGLAVVPTDPEGTPTDSEGTPLPDGKAPNTPVTEFEDKPASDTTAIIGAGGATALLMVAGGVL